MIKTSYYEKHEEVQKDGTTFGECIYKLGDEKTVQYAIGNDTFIFVAQNNLERRGNEGRASESLESAKNTNAEDEKIYPVVSEQTKNDSVFRSKRYMMDKSYEKEQKIDQNSSNLETTTSNNKNLPSSELASEYVPTDLMSEESESSVPENLPYSTEKVPVISVPNVEQLFIDFVHIPTL